MNGLEQFGLRTIHDIHETGPGSHITNVAGRMIQTVGRFSTDFYMLGREGGERWEGAGGSDAAHMRPTLPILSSDKGPAPDPKFKDVPTLEASSKFNELRHKNDPIHR